MRRFLPLKYISFLMILTSLVRLVFGLGMINIFVTARSFGGEQEALTLALIAFLLILCCAVCEMVCGFHGALNWEEPLRAGRTFAWGCAALALTTMVIYVPFLAKAFDFASIDLTEYCVAMALAVAVIPVVEIVKFFQRKAAKRG